MIRGQPFSFLLKSSKIFRRSRGFFLTLVFGSRLVLAANPSVESAYALFLDKKRSEALHLLSKQIRMKLNNSKQKKELEQAFREIAEGFLTNEAQQMYERSLLLKRSDPSGSLQLIEKALLAEPDHFLLWLERARLKMVRGECREALQEITDEPLFKELLEKSLLFHQLQLCLAEAENLKSASKVDLSFHKSRALEFDKSGQGLHWGLIQAQKAFMAGQWQQAKDWLKWVQQKDSQFPETHYWLWRISREIKENSSESARAYLRLCQKMTPAQERIWSKEVYLCRRVALLESEGKKPDFEKPKNANGS
ncbi:MAG: hypothetical protein WCH11_01600 [Bdellovibrio sp.]